MKSRIPLEHVKNRNSQQAVPVFAYQEKIPVDQDAVMREDQQVGDDANHDEWADGISTLMVTAQCRQGECPESSSIKTWRTA